MAQDFLLEIGTEEIPAGFLLQAYQDLEDQTRKLLTYHRLPFADIKTMGTPRRLVVLVTGLAERQEDRIVEKLGPAKKVAFDAAGQPTKAAIGFARGQGVEVAELAVVTTEKGEYLCARKQESGQATIDILAAALPDFILSIPFRKSMRWKDLDLRFARPLHWLVALFGDQVIPFQLGELHTDRLSRGHRFMAPAAFSLANPGEYRESCRRARVIVDPGERQAMIEAQLAEIENQVGGQLISDPELLATVTNLVEYPAAACGNFEEHFLDLPEEVLITVMRHHQKYFSLRSPEGRLLPHFITINNTVARDPQLVVTGNERVLRARLNDARFFFEEDRQTPLEDFVERLKSVVFQAKLGTSYEKMIRFRTLAAELADRLCPEKKEKVSRTAFLCKADLESSMVYEFPDLQGIMGQEYARLAGEDPEVSRGIYEHYLPVAAGGELPTGDCGALVSIADKIDTICGCFGIGLLPTGGADPYALRRQALGIIHIILDRRYELDLSWLVDRSLELLAAKIEREPAQVATEVLNFIKGRLQHNLTAKGVPSGVVEAVLHAGIDNLMVASDKIEAVNTFRHRDDIEPLLAAFKRVMNIIKGSEGKALPLDPDLLTTPEEERLHAEYTRISADCRQAIAGRDFLKALEVMAELKPAVDDFFDHVMVMVDDEALKNNRLALLQAIAAMFRQVADFAKL